MKGSKSQTRTNKFTLILLAAAFFYAAVVQTTNWRQSSTLETSNSSIELHWIHKVFFDVKNTGDYGCNEETNLRRNLRIQPERHDRLLPQDSVSNSQNDNDNNSNTDPIDPHNKICRDYLLKFLQGSTDTNDECQGLENAYSAADCSEEISLVSELSIVADAPPNKNATVTDDTKDNTDDTPTIDDFFEEFQCCKVISHYYSSRCLYHHQYASLSLLGIVAVLIMCNLTKSALHILQIKWLPEAGGCILVGSVVGAILTTQLPDYQMNLGTFNPDLFLFILLPPIIFHASLSIDKQKFRSYLFPIMMFAVMGTIVSAIITGFTVHYLTKVIGFVTTTIPLLDSMIFGALISSIDPVAVLSIMHSMGVSDTDMLYVLVFGESILNDGVSIAMFESLIMHLSGSKQEGTLDNALIWSSAQYFWRVSWMSILIGGAVGISCTIYFWALRGRHGPVAEVASFFCFAMLAYYVSDGVGGSGIVSIMIAGILMDVYVRGSHLTEGDTVREFQQVPSGPGSSLGVDEAVHSQSDERAGYPLPPSCRVPSYTDLRVMFSGVGHISNRAKIHVGFVADVLANLMETSIFAYLGLFLFSNKKWDDIPLILVGVFSCVISRVIMIAIISMIVNIGGWFQDIGKSWGSDNSNPMPVDEQRPRLYIDSNMQLVMLFSGMRGAVSLALAENIPLYDAVTKHGSQFKPALKAMTSSSIIFTVFVFGASTYYTLKKQRDAQQQSDELYGVGNGRSLTTSLLQTHSLELVEEDRATPPWIDQNVTSRDDGNVQ
jgi:NhaP-type Na+/H+ or K+/H+ antiporter